MLAERAEQSTTSGNGNISFSSSLPSSSVLRGGLTHLLLNAFDTFGWTSNWIELMLTGGRVERVCGSVVEVQVPVADWDESPVREGVESSGAKVTRHRSWYWRVPEESETRELS